MTAIEACVFIYCIGYVASVVYWSRELKRFSGRSASAAIIAILGISTYWPFLCLSGWICKLVSFTVKMIDDALQNAEKKV